MATYLVGVCDELKRLDRYCVILCVLVEINYILFIVVCYIYLFKAIVIVYDD